MWSYNTNQVPVPQRKRKMKISLKYSNFNEIIKQIAIFGDVAHKIGWYFKILIISENNR